MGMAGLKVSSAQFSVFSSSLEVAKEQGLNPVIP
jgi:hypothetical protein